ncbi:uncharacterized protein LOC113558844 [Rhopalosiphum maidis]|uniref:uncharacterized protein LOC113558844 n=1 Tax=Rhopalosiphum maidis TaxID=43146 RepID=UPI000F00E46F|nr:uncharacterized protein LOC113558844 [Rhopalosiphum maidis]
MYWKGDKTNRANYIRRLKQLKQNLKLYRNKHTMDCIRVITKSLKLDEHWETLENVLTEDHTDEDVKKCLHNVVNKITVNGVYNGKRMKGQFDMTMDLVENMTNIDVNSTAMAINEMKPFKMNSSAIYNNTKNPFKIDLSANYVNQVNRDDIEPTDNVINKFNHMHLHGCKCYRK